MTEQTCWVFDTNILISRLLTPGGVPAKAVDHALAGGILLVSEDTMNELARVLDRPKFDPYVSRENRRQFISLLGGVARLAPIACKRTKWTGSLLRT
jgi:putative PIN family toxin of toxin-antitoxin system